MGLRFSRAALNHAKNSNTAEMTSPDFDGYAVTPDNSNDLPNGPCAGLVATTGGGNINVDLFGGGTAVLTGLTQGQIVQVQCQRVRATNTTATGIFALYRAG